MTSLLTHTDLHKTNTKWLVHSWSTFGARMNHKQPGHTRLTTARTWGKPPPSPFIVYSAPLHRGHIKMAFCPGTPKWESRNCNSWDSQVGVLKLQQLGLPSGSPEIAIVGTPTTLRAHNFLCRHLMAMRSISKI